MNDNGMPLEPQPMGELATMTPQQQEAAIGQIERAAEAKKRLILGAIKRCYPHDFVDFDGKPYLQGEGANRLCDVGIRLSAPVFEVEVVGDDVFVECLVEADWPAMRQSDTGLGTCNTRDKLWDNKSPRSYMNQCRERAGDNESLARKMLVGHIKKKAHSNATARAVCAVMGIKGLTWDELAAIGFTADKAGAQVKYKRKATKESAAKASEKPEVVSLAVLQTLADGSMSAVVGIIKSFTDGAKSRRFLISDGTEEMNIHVQLDKVADWMTPETEVYFSRVEVALYSNKLYYWGRSFELTEPSGE